MNYKHMISLFFLVLSNLIVIFTMGFVVHVYMEIIRTSNFDPNAGLKLFHLVTTVPIFMIIAYLSRFPYMVSDQNIRKKRIVHLYPLGCMLLVFLQFGILSFYNEQFTFSFCLSIITLGFSLFMAVYDVRMALKTYI